MSNATNLTEEVIEMAKEETKTVKTLKEIKFWFKEVLYPIFSVVLAIASKK